MQVEIRKVPLGQLVENQSLGFEFTDEKVVFVNTGDVLNGKFLHADLVSPVGLPGQAKKSIRRGHILFSEIRPANGRFARVDFEPLNYVVSTKFMVLNQISEEIDPDFLYLQLTSRETLAEFQRIAESRSGTFPQITFDAIAHFPIALPTLDVQKKVTNTLGAIDRKIDLNTKLNQALETMAQALFKSWFVDFDPVIDNALAAGNPIPEPFQARAERRRQRLHELVPEGQSALQPLPAELRQLFPNSFQETEELGWVPEGWSARTCGEISKRIGMGPFGSNIRTSTFVDQGIPVINGQQLKSFLLTEAGYSFITESHFERLKNSSVKSGDIVITHRGTLGQVSLIPRNSRFEKYLVSQSQFFMSPNQSVALSSYLISYFQSRLGQSRLLENVSQVGVPAIARPTSHLKNLYVLVPPNFVQSEFDKFCGAIFDRITSLRSEIDKLTRVRDYLLPKLLSGQLRIPDAEAQLAEAGL